MVNVLAELATTGKCTVVVAVPLLYVLSMTAVFARKREQRQAAREVLAMLWPGSRS